MTPLGALIDHEAPIIFQAIGMLACGALLGRLLFPASGTSGSAQDAKRLDPKGAGPTAEGGDAQ